jgi:hypothetical protein
VIRRGVFFAFVLATTLVALSACTQRHRLGGRYDDAAGGEAGEGAGTGGTSSPGVAGNASGAGANGGGASSTESGGTAGVPASAGRAGGGGTAGEPDENVFL